MFGIRLTSLFTSRWMALAWAVLICLSAIQFVGADGDADEAAAIDPATAQALNGAIDAMN